MDYLDLKEVKMIDFPKNAKHPESDGRFYPKTWTPLLVKGRESFQMRPMRYQLLPHFSQENKYTRINPKTGRKVEIKNTFNARLDALESRHAWEPLFGARHGAICLEAFYEWVDYEENKTLIEFRPKDKSHFWVACLWDHWEKSGEVIESFAMITTDPNPEVLEKGHDRTPVVLKEEYLQEWLNPFDESKEELYGILEDKKDLYFNGAYIY